MSVANTETWALSGRGEQVYYPAALMAEEASMAAPDVEQFRREWNRHVDHPLLDWASRPGTESDDEFVSPTKVAVDCAIGACRSMRDRGDPPPNRVSADGDGGLTLEWWEGTRSRCLHFYDDGDVYLSEFDDSKLEKHFRVY